MVRSGRSALRNARLAPVNLLCRCTSPHTLTFQSRANMSRRLFTFLPKRQIPTHHTPAPQLKTANFARFGPLGPISVAKRSSCPRESFAPLHVSPHFDVQKSCQYEPSTFYFFKQAGRSPGRPGRPTYKSGPVWKSRSNRPDELRTTPALTGSSLRSERTPTRRARPSSSALSRTASRAVKRPSSERVRFGCKKCACERPR